MTDQERLEKLEKRLTPSLAKFARTYGKIDLYDDIAWLLECAKLVRNLENANKSIIDEMDRLMIARAEMEFKYKNAEHELRYYKNPIDVKRFLENNQHQLGYIMKEASRQWVAKDPIGALTVGECNAIVEKYGSYDSLLEKDKKLREAIKKIKNKIKSNDERIERLSKEPQFYDQSRKIERLHGEAFGLENAVKIINETIGGESE